MLLVTDGEEAGLLGASLFTREHPLAKRIWAAVNMDTRGVSGPSLMFETGTANAWLMRLYGRSTLEPITNSLCYVIYKTLPNNTDFTVFKAASYQGFNLAFIGDVAYYHTPLDSFENASPSTMQHQGANALSGLLALANADRHQSACRGLPVLRRARAQRHCLAHRSRAAGRAGGARALGSGGGSIDSSGTPQLRAKRRLVSSARSPMSLLGGVLGDRRARAIAYLREAPAHPRAFLDRSPAGDARGIRGVDVADDDRHRGVVRCAARAFGVFGSAPACWPHSCRWPVALIIPAAGYVVLLAALAAVLGFVPSAWALIEGPQRHRKAPRTSPCSFPASSRLALLLPLLLLLYPALGAPAWPIGTMTLCVTAAFLLPLLDNATRPVRQRLAVIAAATTFGAICITVLLPTYSAELAAACEH